jgi:cell shape-determining protein MreD
MRHFAPRLVLLLAVAWLAAVFDCGVMPLVELRSCTPSACLLAAAASVALSKSDHAFLTAGGFGLAADLSGAGRMGLAMGCFALVGYAVVRLRATSKLHGMLRQAVELTVATLAMSVALALLHACFAGTEIAWPWLLKQALGAGLYTLALATPVLMLLVSTRTALFSNS